LAIEKIKNLKFLDFFFLNTLEYQEKGGRMLITIDDIKKNKKAKRLKHKFKAARCERWGKKFPSKLERAFYEKLVELQEKGEVLFFIRQPAFDLASNLRYFADFLVFWADGTADFIDTKSRDTTLSLAKRKMVEELFPVEIKIIKKVI